MRPDAAFATFVGSLWVFGIKIPFFNSLQRDRQLIVAVESRQGKSQEPQNELPGALRISRIVEKW